MNKDLINQLKNNEKALGLLSIEEKACFEKVGKENCLCYSESGWQEVGIGTFLKSMIYAIKSDYQPEPEYVGLEIVKCEQDSGEWLGVHSDGFSFLPYQFTHLHCLPSLPSFVGFYYERAGGITPGSIFATSVAKKIRQGETVCARFERKI